MRRVGRYGGRIDKPIVAVPDGDPPSELQVFDDQVGDGPEATAGSRVSVHYVGVAWSNGEQFDASWDRGAPLRFPLSGVIAGWQQGIPGMRVGGRRQLVIPPALAYGESGGHRLAGRTLVFIIDLINVG